MNDLVVDASVLALALGDDGLNGRKARERLVETTIVAPELIDLEVLSTLRRAVALGTLEQNRANQALTKLEELTIVRFSHKRFLIAIWQHRHNLTVYDAAYVALARQLHIPLLTADQRLANAPGLDCQIELFQPEE